MKVEVILDISDLNDNSRVVLPNGMFRQTCLREEINFGNFSKFAQVVMCAAFLAEGIVTFHGENGIAQAIRRPLGI